MRVDESFFSIEFLIISSRLSSTLMQLLFSFNRGMGVEKTLDSHQFSCSFEQRLISTVSACDPDTLSIIQNNLELIVSDMVKRNIGTHYLYSSPRLTSIVYALSIMSKNRKNTGHHWLASSLFLTTKNIAKNP